MRRNHAARHHFDFKPIAHTYSIVAFDPMAHEMGVAVQSHWFSVGTGVTWAEAGIGVIATQAITNTSFGLRGLRMLKRGLSAKKVVDKLTQSDKGRENRQLAVLDACGRLAAFTGKNCISEAGHIVGRTYSVQANMMLDKRVWPAMSKSFEKAKGRLAERMLTALEAAQRAGGDIRGCQSAAILVVRNKPSRRPWEDRLIDLRVDDSKEPLADLKRLLRIHRAYEHYESTAPAIESCNMKLARRHFVAAERMYPENEEIRFWHAVALVDTGRVKEALPLFKEVFGKNDNWRELLRRLVPSGLSLNEDRLEEILRQ